MYKEELFIEELPVFLSKEENNILFEQMKNGSINAREKLIIHNLRLITNRIYKRYKSYEDKKELFSIGEIGLIKAEILLK